MRFKLVEDFGESEELNTFVFQTANRFRTYYQVEITKGISVESIRYFSYEDAARDYYNKMVEIFNSSKDLYSGTNITLEKVEIERNYDELESSYID